MKRVLTHWKKHEAVQSIRRSRIFFKNEFLDIRIHPKKSLLARVLVVTPRKSGTAVARNTFRRRAKALFYENQLYQGDFDWIIFAKPNIAELSFKNLCALFTTLAQKLSRPS